MRGQSFVLFTERCALICFLLIIMLLCVSVFAQSTNLEWLMVLIACENKYVCLADVVEMHVRLVTRGVYVKRFWSGAGINKMLLSDNGSGVLLSTAGARLLNRTPCRNQPCA